MSGISEKAKTSAELNPKGKEEYCRGCYEEEVECPNCFWNREKWVRLEDARQEIVKHGKNNEALAKVCSNLNDKIERLERERGLQKQKLRSVLEDMQKIPERRLPLGKIGWLQEWSDVIVALGRLLE